LHCAHNDMFDLPHNPLAKVAAGLAVHPLSRLESQVRRGSLHRRP
jgi:hypothetical protein